MYSELHDLYTELYLPGGIKISQAVFLVHIYTYVQNICCYNIQLVYILSIYMLLQLLSLRLFYATATIHDRRTAFDSLICASFTQNMKNEKFWPDISNSGFSGDKTRQFNVVRHFCPPNKTKYVSCVSFQKIAKFAGFTVIPI